MTNKEAGRTNAYRAIYEARMAAMAVLISGGRFFVNAEEHEQIEQQFADLAKRADDFDAAEAA